MEDFEGAVAEIERASGGTLPPDYREWLRQHRPKASDHRQMPFGLAELIETQRLVQDVIPPGTLAVGDDGYGNLVLLRFADGSIEWWNHERNRGNFDTETIRSSFAEYLDLIANGEV